MEKFNSTQFGLYGSVLFLMALTVFGCKSDSGNKNCEDFKTGVFKYEDSKFAQWRVTRTETTQTEVNDSLNISIESKVLWLSDCEFQLINEGEKPGQYLKLTDTLTVEFTEIKDNSYTYHAFGGGSETKGAMVKVE